MSEPESRPTRDIAAVMASPQSVPEQLVFDMPVRRALGRRDYLVTDCNAAAVSWLDGWPNWRHSGLVLCGAPASGKTHLASVWDARAKAVWLDGEALDRMASGEPTSSRTVVLDDLDRVLRANPAREETVFHLFNRLKGSGGSLLITAETPPARWRIDLLDLASRLNALPKVQIGAPDDPLLAALIVKHFRDRQLHIHPGVVAYVVKRIDRSFQGVDDAVAALDREALAGGRPVTIPLARQALDRMRRVS